MTLTRRTGALAALALTLVLGACSTPADLSVPTLEAQFGTSDNDFGVDVAYPSSGRVYVLSEQAGYYYDEYSSDEGSLETAILSRYDGNGNFVWSRDVASDSCSYAYDCYNDSLNTRMLTTDTRGYLYALTSTSYVYDDSHKVTPLTVTKYDASGNRIRSFSVGQTGYGFGDDQTASEKISDIAADGSGNVYVVRVQYDIDDNYFGSYSNVVTKYAATGGLLWQRTSPVGTPYSVTVSSSGLVYVGGSTGVAKYSNGGDLIRKIASGDTRDVAAVGTNTVYARNLTTVRKLDANGRQLWSKAQTGLSGLVIGDMTTDSSANVYLTGKYGPSTNRDVFVRKLSASSGATAYSKVFATSAYDDGRGIATLTGSEVYVTGETQGSLAHANYGGSDGYLRKMDANGNRVWTK